MRRRTAGISIAGGVLVVAVGGIVAGTAMSGHGSTSEHVTAANAAQLSGPRTAWSPQAGQASTPPSTPASTHPSSTPSPTPSTRVLGVTVAKPPITYVVRPGDNLFVISAWFHLHGYGALYDANRAVIGADPNLIFPGQRITIAGGKLTMSSR